MPFGQVEQLNAPELFAYFPDTHSAHLHKLSQFESQKSYQVWLHVLLWEIISFTRHTCVELYEYPLLEHVLSLTLCALARSIQRICSPWTNPALVVIQARRPPCLACRALQQIESEVVDGWILGALGGEEVLIPATR